MADRDINGMQARNWKKADVSALLSRSVKSKNDNVELFSAIKDVVSDAVTAIRGKVDDDKYRNIVDLIMMRVRAALAASNADIDAQALLQDISERVDEKIKSIDVPQSLEIKDTQLASIASTIIAAIQSNSRPSAKTATESEERSEEKQQPVQQALAPVSEAKVDTTQYAKIVNGINQQIEELDDLVKANISSIDRIYKQDNIDFDTFQDLILDTLENLEIIINKGEEVNKKIIKCIQDVGAGQGLGMKKAQSNTKAAKELRRQLNNVRAYIDEKTVSVNKKIAALDSGVAKKIDEQNKVLDGIIKRLDKSGISLMTLLMIIGAIGAIIVPKIWPWLKETLEPIIPDVLKKIDFKKIIDDCINAIDFSKLKEKVSPILEEIKKTAIDWIKDILSNPIEFIKKSFNDAWNQCIEWKDDIWNWITGKEKKIAKQKNKQEAEAEKRITKTLSDNQQKTENLMAQNQVNLDSKLKEADKNLENTVKKTDQANKTQAEQIQNQVQNTAQDVTATASQAVENVNQETVKITENVQQQSQDINENVLPAMSQELSEKTENGLDNLNSQVNQQIKKAEDNAEKNLKDLEEETKKAGPPTDVTQEHLEKLEANGQGAKLKSDNMSGPKTVNSIKVEHNGAEKNMYSKKEDTAAIQAAQKGSDDLRNAGGLPAPSDIVGPSAPELNGKIVVQADSPNFAQGKPAEFRDLLVQAGGIELAFKEGNKLLESVLGNVNAYFKDLNLCIDKIGKSKPSEDNNNTVILASNAGDSVMAENNR